MTRTEQTACALIVGLIFFGPGIASAVSVSALLSGAYFRGGVSLLLYPAFFAYALWDTRYSFDFPEDTIKYGFLSWLAGLPIGAASWGIFKVVQWMISPSTPW